MATYVAPFRARLPVSTLVTGSIARTCSQGSGGEWGTSALRTASAIHRSQIGGTLLSLGVVFARFSTNVPEVIMRAWMRALFAGACRLTDSPLPAAGVVLLVPVLAVQAARADWPSDPTVNVALSTAAGGESYPTIAPDGSGGAIVTWGDGRNGKTDIYAQRVNAAGVPQWTTNGVELCGAVGHQIFPTI